jgi:hypothetical protein
MGFAAICVSELEAKAICNGFAAIYCFSELQAKAICNYNHNITAKKHLTLMVKET